VDVFVEQHANADSDGFPSELSSKRLARCDEHRGDRLDASFRLQTRLSRRRRRALLVNLAFRPELVAGSSRLSRTRTFSAFLDSWDRKTRVCGRRNPAKRLLTYDQSL
jgi:hypothetical protein